MSDSEKPVDRSRSPKKSWVSSSLAGIFAVSTLFLTFIQISEDVETLSDPTPSPTEQFVIDTKSEASAYELIARGGIQCFLDSIWFMENGAPNFEITEAKWRSEDRLLDVEFNFNCVYEGQIFRIGVTNFLQTDPGSIAIDANSNEVAGGMLSVDVLVQKWDGTYCEYKPLSTSGEVQGNVTYFQKSAKGFFDYADGCDLISLGNPIYLADGISIDREASLRIDQLARDATPEGCYFIGALLSTADGLPEEEDKAAIDFMNANYMSWSWFEISSFTPADYIFDESLSVKIDHQPQWAYYCTDEGLDFSEFTIGGMIYESESGAYRRPAADEFNLRFFPWLETPYDAEIEISFYDKDLNLCEVASGTISPFTEFDTFYRYDENIRIEGFDLTACPISLLTYFNGIAG